MSAFMNASSSASSSSCVLGFLDSRAGRGPLVLIGPTPFRLDSYQYPLCGVNRSAAYVGCGLGALGAPLKRSSRGAFSIRCMSEPGAPRRFGRPAEVAGWWKVMVIGWPGKRHRKSSEPYQRLKQGRTKGTIPLASFPSNCLFAAVASSAVS